MIGFVFTVVACSREAMMSNGNNGDARGERLQVMLSPDELSALDDFRFKTRMPSRASAVRELLKRGLAAEGFLSTDAGSKSADFGVIHTDQASDRTGRPPRKGR
jgi:hypothetical protein